MSAITLRRRLRDYRRRLIATAVVLVLAAAITVHHSGMATPAVHDEHGMTAAIEMCLAVMTAVGTAVVAIALGILALGRWRPVRMLMSAGRSWRAHPPMPRARAGPVVLSLLCVSRR